MGSYTKGAQFYHKDMSSTMFIAALFIIARPWKQLRCPLTKEWIKKMWYIYTMEYSSAIKYNYILKSAGKRMELEKKTQTQNNKHSMYSLISGYQI